MSVYEDPHPEMADIEYRKRAAAACGEEFEEPPNPYTEQARQNLAEAQAAFDRGESDHPRS
jgi:hypothetical protein